MGRQVHTAVACWRVVAEPTMEQRVRELDRELSTLNVILIICLIGSILAGVLVHWGIAAITLILPLTILMRSATGRMQRRRILHPHPARPVPVEPETWADRPDDAWVGVETDPYASSYGRRDWRPAVANILVVTAGVLVATGVALLVWVSTIAGGALVAAGIIALVARTRLAT